MDVVFWSLAAFWLLLTLRDLRGVAAWRDLPTAMPAATPVVTAVIAVRDDASHIATTIEGLLAQQGVALAVSVVDDRSGDGTGAVLAAFAAREPRLTVHTVQELPPGWLGKVHALHVGARNTTADWLLFADSDSQLRPTTLAAAVAAAERDGADHLVLMPGHRAPTFWGMACVLGFHQVVQARLRAVNGPRQRTSVGTGAFNLVRASAYRAIGGHQPLRLEVVDDVGMGTLLFRAGFRSRSYYAARELLTDWGRTPASLVAGVEKNMFAILGYHTVWVSFLLVGAFALLATTAAAPFVGGAAAWCAVGAYALTAAPPMWIAAKMGWPVRAGLLVLFTRVLMPWALLRSMWLTLWRGGVLWRGTLYPLRELRAGRVG
jgi:glycosyltransferase involved in cell wall biosynthesis